MKPQLHAEDHLPEADILALLSGEVAPEKEESARQHVEVCETCRTALETFAAGPAVWQHVSSLVAEANSMESLSGRISSESARGWSAEMLATRETISEGVVADATDSLSFLLDAPSHPEWLGRLGGYDIEREIGRGGMGAVFKAFDSNLNRPVAIKVMLPMLAGRGAARERFSREARAAAAILHPNVIAIHGVSVSERVPWIVMPYIQGPSLEQVVEKAGPLPETEVVRIALQIASGLAAAHAQGVIHRDIKPANILLENGVGRVVITDFGLARAENDVSMTQTGWFAGTPAFMSPEQSRGNDLDARSDLFSLGSVMYYMATGRCPFRSEQPMAILERIRNDVPRPVRSINNLVSPTLSQIIDDLLAKQPAERIQSAAELQEILEHYLAHLQHPLRVKHSGYRSHRLRRQRWRRVGMVGLCLAAIGFGAAIAAWGPWAGAGETRLDPAAAATAFQQRVEEIKQKYGLVPLDTFERELGQMGQQVQQMQQVLIQEFARQPVLNDPLLDELQSLESAMESMQQMLRDPR